MRLKFWQDKPKKECQHNELHKDVVILHRTSCKDCFKMIEQYRLTPKEFWDLIKLQNSASNKPNPTSGKHE